ncbi:MAG: DUF6089 family protein [Bacteroidota bacterium]
MKRPFLIMILVLIAAIVMPDIAEAQKRYRRKRGNSKRIRKYSGNKRRTTGRFRPYTFVGANLNAGNYFGDLAPVNRAASTDISFTRPGFGGFIGKRINPWVSVRASLNWVRLSGSDFSADPAGEGSDPQRYARNLSFRNDVFELGLGAEIDLLKNVGSSNRRVPFTPYLFVGIGGFYHNPQGQVPDFDVNHPDYNRADPSASPETARFSNAGKFVGLRALGTEGQNFTSTLEPYSNFQVNIPIAIGFRLRLPENFDASIEFGLRYLFFDYLDDVSRANFADQDLFEDPLARALADRSQEHVDVFSGDLRVPALVNGSPYTVTDIRGNPDDNDLYFVTQLKLSYILNGIRSTAKFR